MRNHVRNHCTCMQGVHSARQPIHACNAHMHLQSEHCSVWQAHTGCAATIATSTAILPHSSLTANAKQLRSNATAFSPAHRHLLVQPPNNSQPIRTASHPHYVRSFSMQQQPAVTIAHAMLHYKVHTQCCIAALLQPLIQGAVSAVATFTLCPFRSCRLTACPQCCTAVATPCRAQSVPPRSSHPPQVACPVGSWPSRSCRLTSCLQCSLQVPTQGVQPPHPRYCKMQLPPTAS